MLRLLLLRHAKSSWNHPGLRDHDRPLARRGLRDAPRMGRYLREHGLTPAAALVSTAVRARTTAELALEAAGAAPGALRLIPDLYGSSPDEIVEIVAEEGGSASPLLVVAHNPGMEDLAARFLGRYEHFPTAALLVAEVPAPDWARLVPARAAVEAFIRPRELPEIGEADPPRLLSGQSALSLSRWSNRNRALAQPAARGETVAGDSRIGGPKQPVTRSRAWPRAASTVTRPHVAAFRLGQSTGTDFRGHHPEAALAGLRQLNVGPLPSGSADLRSRAVMNPRITPGSHKAPFPVRSEFRLRWARTFGWVQALRIVCVGSTSCGEPARTKFLSLEPLLGPGGLTLDGVDWVIAGGLARPHAKGPAHPRHVRG